MSRASNLPACTGVGSSQRHFRDHPRRGAADRILRGPRGELHGAGGPPHAQLGALRRTLCVVGTRRRAVNGSMRPLNRDHLVRLKMLCDRYAPESFSEHLAWSSHDDVYLKRPACAALYTADAAAGPSTSMKCRRARTPDIAGKSVYVHRF